MSRFWHVIISILLSAVWLLLVRIATASDAHGYFKILVVDETTGRGVPLVELKTMNQVRYYTDSNGIAAFYEPGLMGQEVNFHVKSHGYEFRSQNFFGERAKELKVTQGGSALLKIKRLNIAERLYRLTGEGIYRDSVLVGHPVPLKRPLLSGKVMGQDGTVAMPYRGKIYWFWGDTHGPANLNLAVSGATSEWPSKGGLDPSVGVDLTYFVNESGFSKPMCPIPGPGLVWVGGLVTVTDEKGAERLLIKYERIKNLGEPYERGLAVFNDRTKTFERLVQFDLSAPLYLDGHPFRATVDGVDYYYFSFSTPYAIRVRADLKHLMDPKTYEAFTPLVTGSRYEESLSRLDRGPDGRLVYAWKANTQPIGYDQQKELMAAGKMKPEEAWFHLQDIETGVSIKPHAGSVFWNDFRKRWVMVVEQTGGTSPYGEMWYAEADTPLGPWVYARKIVTHDQYTFYNPTQHPFFDQEGGRLIYFDGTYSDLLSGSPEKTPRYDYNQIMYRLALDDPRLFLPAPVYGVKGADGARHYLLREGVASQNQWDRIEEVAFFALPPDRRYEGLVPILATVDRAASPKGVTFQRKAPATKAAPAPPLFYALPAAFTSWGERLTGTWRCKARMADGSEYPLILELKLDGERLKGRLLQDDLTVAKATFKEGKLALELKENTTVYTLTATLKQEKLIGEWKQSDSGESGMWEGERVDWAWQQMTSPAVVPLYEYRRGDGTRFYSTDAGLTDPALKRSAEPICRVWRNPMSLVILDYKAKPVPFLRITDQTAPADRKR